MFDWLLDDFWIIAFLLAAAAVAFSVAWWRTRKKPYAFGAGAFILLLGVYIALFFLIETSRQQMERRVREIAVSVKNKQIRSALEKNLADDFHIATYDKLAFLDKAQSLRDHFGVDALDVRDFKLVELDREKKTATFHFIAQPLVPDQQTPWYLVKARFVMTSKGAWTEEWKMQSFEYFNAIVDTNSPLPIP